MQWSIFDLVVKYNIQLSKRNIKFYKLLKEIHKDPKYNNIAYINKQVEYESLVKIQLKYCKDSSVNISCNNKTRLSDISVKEIA